MTICHKVLTSFVNITTTDFIAASSISFFVKDENIVTDYFNKLTNNYCTYDVRNIFGGYFEREYRYYLMFEDGTIYDRISTKTKKFDPLLPLKVSGNL